MTKQEMMDKCIEAAVEATKAAFAVLAEVPQENRATVETYALSRALAAVLVHRLSKRIPTPEERAIFDQAFTLHCDVIAAHFQEGGTWVH